MSRISNLAKLTNIVFPVNLDPDKANVIGVSMEHAISTDNAILSSSKYKGI